MKFTLFIPQVVFASVPTVIFHGLNDNCLKNFELTKIIERSTGSPAICIEIGNGVETTWHQSFSEQAREACQKVMDNQMLQESPEINAIGFSQGGLLARYIAQGCDIKGKVRNLVTVGTPNMGYVDPPKCQNFAKDLYENYIQKLENGRFLSANVLSAVNMMADTYVQEIICSVGTFILEAIVHFSYTYI